MGDKKIKNILCPYCDKRYCSKQGLNAHLKTIHKNIYNKTISKGKKPKSLINGNNQKSSKRSRSRSSSPSTSRLSSRSRSRSRNKRKEIEKGDDDIDDDEDEET